jgi:hypothetical protein
MAIFLLQSGQTKTAMPIEPRSSITHVSSIIHGLSVALREISATIKSSLDISVSRPTPPTREPQNPVSTSIDIPESQSHLRLAELVTYTESGGSRRHSVNIHDRTKTSSTRGSLEPFNYHVRSITAPLTISLSSPKKSGPGKENVVR